MAFSIRRHCHFPLLLDDDVSATGAERVICFAKSHMPDIPTSAQRLSSAARRRESSTIVNPNLCESSRPVAPAAQPLSAGATDCVKTRRGGAAALGSGNLSARMGRNMRSVSGILPQVVGVLSFHTGSRISCVADEPARTARRRTGEPAKPELGPRVATSAACDCSAAAGMTYSLRRWAHAPDMSQPSLRISPAIVARADLNDPLRLPNRASTTLAATTA